MVGALLVILAFSLAVPSAHAATATLSFDGNGSDDGIGGLTGPRTLSFYTLRVQAGAGEANQLEVRSGEPVGAVDVVDMGAVLEAGTGCQPVDAHRVRCDFTGSGSPRVGALIDAGDGDDTVTLGGPVAANLVHAAAGDDRVIGGASADVIDGGTGADVISGGGGADEATYAGRTAPVTVTLDGQPDDGEAGEGDDVAMDIERVSGGAGADLLSSGSAGSLLVGNGGDDVLRGGDGFDYLEGGDGADRMEGGGGDDEFVGGPGPDTFIGGDGGADEVMYFHSPVAVTVDLDGVADDGAPGEGDNVGEDVEELDGSRYNDVLVGSEAADSIDGTDGLDWIYGLGGNDRLVGGRRGGLIDGGAGADHISASLDADVFDSLTRVQAGDGETDTISCFGRFELEVDPSDDTSGCRRRGVIGVDEFDVPVGTRGFGRLRATLHSHYREASGKFVVMPGFKSKRVLATGRFSLRYGVRKSLRFKLSEGALRRVRRSGDMGIRARARFRGVAGNGEPIFGTGYFRLVRRSR